MFLLGIISLIQIILLPGFIFLKLLKIKTEGIIELFLYSFGLSLYSNYLIVSFLTWLNIYTSFSVYFLFLMEIVILLLLIQKGTVHFSSKKYLRDYYKKLKQYIDGLSLVHKLLFQVSCIVILFFISLIPVNASNIFFFSDIIHFWNKLALVWASNSIPSATSHYPQLFTTNISLNYVFMGSNLVPFFIKAFAPLFSISILLMYFDLSIKKNSKVYLIGLLSYAAILIFFYSILYIFDANADIIVSFYSFLAFYVLLKKDIFEFNPRTIFLIITFASSAADTKLVGLYVLGLSILWIAFVLYVNRMRLKASDIIKAVIIIALIFSGNLFWYLIKPNNMLPGFDQSQFLPAGYLARIHQGMQILFYNFGYLLSIYFLSTIVYSLLVRQSKYITLVVIIPPVLFWLFFYCYDYRNLSIVIPFIPYSSAWGLKYFYENNDWLKRLIYKLNSKKYHVPKLLKTKNPIFYLIFILFIISIFFIVSTHSFFNIGIYLSYFINKYYYLYHRTIFTSENGYYKTVEYIIDALKIFCVISIILFVFIKTKIKLSYLLILFGVSIILLNFTVLRKENLIEFKNYKFEMVDAHNLQYNLYPYIIDKKNSGTILTNYSPICNLIEPNGVRYKYDKNINKIISSSNEIKNNNCLVLLKESKLDDKTKKFIKLQVKEKKIDIHYYDGEFIFLKVIS